MRAPAGAATWVAAIVALAAAALTVGRVVEVHTGMEDFVLDAAESERLGILGRMVSSKRARTMAFVLGAEDATVHRQAARELRRRLGETGHFTWVRGGSEGRDSEAFYQLFFPHRFALLELPATDAELPLWLDGRIAAAKAHLIGPMGAMMGRLLAQDPVAAFPEILRRLESSNPAVKENAGQLESADGRWSVVFAEAKAPALAGALQLPVVSSIDGILADLRGQAKGALVTHWTGVNRFAVETERRIKQELGYIAVLSTVPVLFLYLLVFRSLRQFFAGLIIIGNALAAAVLACQGVFGAVHGLALTFGASLIGVTIDYAAHYSVHLAASSTEQRPALLRMLLRATTTGVVTTVAAFAAIAGGRLPVLQQIAFLGVTGAVTAFALTHWLLPKFVPARAEAAFEPRARRHRDVILQALDRNARGVMVATAVVLALATAGLVRWRWQDSVDAFKTPLPALEAETALVQRILGQDGRAPNVIVTGPDDEAALLLHETVRARLIELQRVGRVGSFNSVQPLLPSAATQRRRLDRLAAANLEEFYRAALARHGFRADAFPTWQELLHGMIPLGPNEIASAPLSFLVDAWRIDPPRRDGPGAGYVIDLKDVPDETVLTTALADLPGVFVIHPAGLLEETYAFFRDRIVLWLGIGTLAVVFIMLAVYRRASFVIAGVLPALLGAAATLGLLAHLGIAGNVLHVVGLVLVLGLGVDYGVYLVEAREGSIGLSIRGILLGAATTCISFGALAFSSNAAVHTLGLTSALGIIFTTATCPLVIFIVQGRKKGTP